MTSFAELTTFRVGGPIARLVDVAGVDELAALFAEAGDEPVMVLGGGSNLLVTDDGFAGTVARMVGDGLAVSGGADDGSDDSVDVLVEAGANWDALVEYTVEQGWAGIEALSGIPGSVGATPIQNVGAYGQEVADVITAVRTFDRETGTERRFAPADCNFAYRDSLFKRTSRFVVTAVEFRLTAGGTGAPVRYAELARALGVEVGGTAPIADVRAAVLGLRRSKGMVLDPDDHDTWSAGSFFTNPILTSAVAGAALPDDAPRYPAGDGLVKTSAAWLIEHAGFSKGFGAELTGGRATLSTKHTLALTNRGGASAADLLTLARAVRAGVLDRFGIELHHEPVLVGHTL